MNLENQNEKRAGEERGLEKNFCWVEVGGGWATGDWNRKKVKGAYTGLERKRQLRGGEDFRKKLQ